MKHQRINFTHLCHFCKRHPTSLITLLRPRLLIKRMRLNKVMNPHRCLGNWFLTGLIQDLNFDFRAHRILFRNRGALTHPQTKSQNDKRYDFQRIFHDFFSKAIDGIHQFANTSLPWPLLSKEKNYPFCKSSISLKFLKGCLSLCAISCVIFSGARKTTAFPGQKKPNRFQKLIALNTA